MLVIFFRTIIIYLLLIITMRVMGKRQLGELELSELVTTLLLSEIAALPITDPNIPVMFSVIPIITLLSLEILLSALLIKCPSLKNLLSSRPNVIIEKGRLRQSELKKLRISNDELLCELRQSGITDLSEVYYAIVEENGKLTVVPRKSSQPPTASQLKTDTVESGISHIVISDGKVDSRGLETVGVSQDELELYLKNNGCRVCDVFLLLCDDSGKYTLILKDKKS